MAEDATSAAIGAADRAYLTQDWAGALAAYERIWQADGAAAFRESLPLLIGHCRIEMGAHPTGSDTAPRTAAPTGSPREQQLIQNIRIRALQLCRAGDVVRASELLRLLLSYDRAIDEAYDDILGRREPRGQPAPPDDRDPPFLQALGIATLPVAAIKAAHRGKRLLLVYRRFFPESDARRSEVIECLAGSARHFGLDVREFKLADPTQLGPALLQDILSFKPDLIVLDREYPFSLPGDPAQTRDTLENILALARQQMGVRVVHSYMDAWMSLETGAPELFRGLGNSYDVVQHAHPAALGVGTPDQNARTHCYMLPAWVAEPSVAPGTVPRACFVGSISWFNVARLAWWAEALRLGLPIDFLETLHTPGQPKSDQAYIDPQVRYQMALNFTRRSGGPKIMTARALEIPLAGGLLVEEASPNTAFFLAPNRHYVGFESLQDLARLVVDLLNDPARRERIRCDGQRWVATYFTGDHYWAGLLDRLDKLA